MICYKCKKETKKYRILACDKPYVNLFFCELDFPLEINEQIKYIKEYISEERSQPTVDASSRSTKNRKRGASAKL